MKRLVLQLFFSAVLLCAWPMSAHAAVGEVYSPAEVVVLNKSADGSVIVIEGEAVGDKLRAVGGGTWVNVLGDEVGLGVWASDEMIDQIEYLGAYKERGDVVRVTGTLNMTCQEHGGEFDLHAEDIQILAQGQPIDHEPVLARGLVGLAGILIGAGLLYRYRSIRD